MTKKSRFDELTQTTPSGEHLFHYTTLEGLIGIVNSGQLWATNIHFLNDFQEFKHALELTKKMLQRTPVSASERNFKIKLEELIEEIKKVNIHIVSLTAASDLLSQWRAYCPAGGVSMGFNYKWLPKLANTNNFEIRKCIYEHSEQQEILKEFIEGMLELLRKGTDQESLENTFINRMSIIAPCFKDKAFAEEEEWRLISSFVSSEDDDVDLRVKNNTLVPYYKFSLKGLEEKMGRINLGFDKCIIGPSASSELTDHAFSYLINRHKLYLKRNLSKIPYRTL